MEYICDRDYDYIMNKYHDQNKPFNAHRRFIRHDEIFDETTGMAGDDIIAGILAQDETLASLPHPVRKAQAFALFYPLLDGTTAKVQLQERQVPFLSFLSDEKSR